MSERSRPLPAEAEGAAATISVLLVEDPPPGREGLSELLGRHPSLRLAGLARSGEEGLAAAARLHPQVVVMDVHLPGLDGFAAARRIMETCPTRIILLTADTSARDVAGTFKALEAGALVVLAKPAEPGSPASETAAAELVETIRLMAEVPVIKRWPRGAKGAAGAPPLPAAAARRARVVAIGASTGGPLVLREILSRLPPTFPVPLLIVQHISPGFAEGFAEWLGTASGYAVRLARRDERAEPGVAHLAPSGMQMGLQADGRIALVDGPEEHGLKPSVSYLFRALAANFGAGAIGVLLTGMGRDGAAELKALRAAGALTIAQNSETSAVFGMPGEAVRLAAAHYVLAPEAIAALLLQLLPPRPPGADGREKR